MCGGGGGGRHEMRLNAKGTVGSFGGRKLIYNKIITRKIYEGGVHCAAPPPPPDPSLGRTHGPVVQCLLNVQ